LHEVPHPEWPHAGPEGFGDPADLTRRVRLIFVVAIQKNILLIFDE